jgi:hypothetical protein
MTSKMTVVCDGWTDPKHPRRMLRPGDPGAGVSFGMCDACAASLIDTANGARLEGAASHADFDEALRRVYAACAGLSTCDQLTVLQIACLAIAASARTEAQISSGGFLEEQVRQLAQLRRMAELIEADEPDLETERLYRERDREGMRRRMQGLMDPGMETGEPPE